jgi:hypothetical protein
LPLTLGLARSGVNEDEDQLLAAACWLRAMDSLSLEILCDRALFESIDYIFPRPGGQPVQLAVGHPAPFVLTLTPWPFDQEEIAAEVPFRRVPAREFSSVDEYRSLYNAAMPEKLTVQIVGK